MTKALRYVSYKDIDIVVDILKIAIKNTEGMHSGQVITPSINRMLLELDDMKKRDTEELLK